jgi:hypothetical protein
MKYSAVVFLAVMTLAVVRGEDSTETYGKTPEPTKAPPPPTKPPPTPTKPPTGGGKGDPIMTGLDGRAFEFFGLPGHTYNVISEKNHQVAMTLKAGQMWDHEGTYMSAVGFTYGTHTVKVENVGDDMTVELDNEPLVLRGAQTEQEVILGLAEGELSLTQFAHKADFGKAVEITTDVLQLTIWLTPAGTRDEGGKVQPAYLNFDVALIATPAHNTLEGIIGETYAAATSNAIAAENDFKFHGVEADYEMASLFTTSHPKSIFGKASAGKARKLIETSPVTFPLRATSRGFSTILKASGRGLVKGRKNL